MDNIVITVFTDPMMGLYYEMRPVTDRLRDLYEVRYVMSGLVRDISDFMTKAELALPEEEGICKYNDRLADIYRREEAIGGVPIRMEGFRLFDKDHRSSYPLCIAYEAAYLADRDKAEAFLDALNHATVYETKQTTREYVIIETACETGIDKDAFVDAFKKGPAEKLFQQDLLLTKRLGIYSLPAFHISKNGKSVLIQSLLSFDDIRGIIDRL